MIRCVSLYQHFYVEFTFICAQVTGATYAEGGVLKHPETIVYRQDAICVSAVVVYA